MRFVAGVSLTIAAVAYLILTAVRNTAEYYLTVDEVKVRQVELSGQMLRVAGRVQPGSIRWDAASLTLEFAITQPPMAESGPSLKKVAAGSPARLEVISRGQPKPDMFAPGRDVIVEGELDGGDTIEARQVLTSCPSKYMPKQD